ncbi:MAG: helix-turn-helix domain-containing protein [Erysipelotrichaceae bacterium]|nr:helix-turn-helix domain-containing protein [Erysipelotrichaceae bacterium]
MKTQFGTRIKQLREKRGLNQEELGEIVGVSDKTVSSWEINRTEPKMGIVQQLADFFNVTTDYLIKGNTADDEDLYQQLDMSYIKVPLYAPISCGNGAFADDNILDYVAVPDDGLNPNKEYFAQIASGDSMIEVGIDSGDIIVFEKSNTIENGKIGCFCIDDNVATCKKFKKGDTFIQLIPANKNYDPIVIDLNNNNFRVIGILKKAIKNYE